jgi:predicted RND superfamily exporter protein
LKVETHILNFFQKNSSIARAYGFIENVLTGLSPIEIVISVTGEQGKDELLSENNLNKIRNLQGFLEQKKGVVSSQSAADIFQDRTKIDLLDLLFLSKAPLYAALDAGLKEFVNKKGTATRVSVKARTLASEQYLTLISDIDEYLVQNFRGGLRAYTTGAVPVIVEMQNILLGNLVKSFAVAFAVISTVFLLIFRSLKKTVICMLPNLLPVIVILGFMGWTRIKLDVATVMIASIAIGIAVDDTIHFVFRYKQECSAGADSAQAILSTLSSTGTAIVWTSLVIFCGFLVLCFSGFKPMIFFGLLTGVTIITALAGDLVMLPALLSTFRVNFNEKQL